jgi:hypothetical protein
MLVRSFVKTWIALLTVCLVALSAPLGAHAQVQQLGVFGGSHHGGRIKTFTGGFTSSLVECDTMCTGGPLTGGLAGTLAWRLDVMESTSNPDVVKLVGVNTITTPTGTLSGTDYTLWNLATGEFVDFTIISSGTGAYAGVTGTLLISGSFDPVAGTGTSQYLAVLRFP